MATNLPRSKETSQPKSFAIRLRLFRRRTVRAIRDLQINRVAGVGADFDGAVESRQIDRLQIRRRDCLLSSASVPDFLGAAHGCGQQGKQKKWKHACFRAQIGEWGQAESGIAWDSCKHGIRANIDDIGNQGRTRADFFFVGLIRSIERLRGDVRIASIA